MHRSLVSFSYRLAFAVRIFQAETASIEAIFEIFTTEFFFFNFFIFVQSSRDCRRFAVGQFCCCQPSTLPIVQWITCQNRSKPQSKPVPWDSSRISVISNRLTHFRWFCSIQSYPMMIQCPQLSTFKIFILKLLTKFPVGICFNLLNSNWIH